jgi:hypothetical protein
VHGGDLVRPTGVPDPAVDGCVDDGVRAAVGQALTGDDLVDELCAAAFHQLGDAVQDLTAVVRRRGRPPVERLARRDHGVASVLA